VAESSKEGCGILEGCFDVDDDDWLHVVKNRHVSVIPDLVWTDVSEVRVASMFRVEKSASEEPAWASCSRLEAERSSETSVHKRSARRHIPEDGILHNHRCENLKSYNFTFTSSLFSREFVSGRMSCWTWASVSRLTCLLCNAGRCSFVSTAVSVCRTEELI
jgi:hypothetical protein